MAVARKPKPAVCLCESALPLLDCEGLGVAELRAADCELMLSLSLPSLVVTVMGRVVVGVATPLGGAVLILLPVVVALTDDEEVPLVP